MGDARKRRGQKRFSIRKIAIIFLLILGIGSIFATIFYTIPHLSSFIWTNGYISPLASKFSLHDALGSTNNKELVKGKMKKIGMHIKEMHEDDQGYIVVLETGEKILLSKKKSLDSQISSLQLISSRFTIEGKHFVQLDLRFDRPVIVPK